MAGLLSNARRLGPGAVPQHPEHESVPTLTSTLTQALYAVILLELSGTAAESLSQRAAAIYKGTDPFGCLPSTKQAKS